MLHPTPRRDRLTLMELTTEEIVMFVIDPYWAACDKRDALNACWSDIGAHITEGTPFAVSGELVTVNRAQYIAAALAFLN